MQRHEATLERMPAPEFTAEVVDIRELARVDGQQVWQLLLDRTLFYPAMPTPRGSLFAKTRSGVELQIDVIAVEEDETGDIWHTIHKPLQVGSAVVGKLHAARPGEASSV